MLPVGHPFRRAHFAKARGALRRPGFFRRHRRSRLQANLSLAPANDPPRQSERARDWRRQSRLESRAASQSRQRQPGQARRRRSRRLPQIDAVAELYRRRLPGPGHLQEAARTPGPGPASHALPGHSSQPFSHRRRRTSRFGLRQKCPRHPGKALRPRSRLGSSARRHLARRLSRVLHLSHRPLPRQRRSRKSALLPFCQHLSRAHLESQLRPEHPDHHGRIFRRRRPRQIL